MRIRPRTSRKTSNKANIPMIATPPMIGKLPIIGGVAIIGMFALLLVFLLVRGRIRIYQGFAGTKILRFASFERFTHWVTASCFVVLALSGLNISFGRILILPLFGAQAFATLSAYAKLCLLYTSDA